jgi:hypothetical protein
MSPFSALCNGLYQPLLDKSSKELFGNTDEIAAKYAARGFPLPPGVMLSEISDQYEKELEIRARIFFDCCCQAYKSSSQKPKAEDFSKQIQNEITSQQENISATGEDVLKQYMKHDDPYPLQIIDIYKQRISSEGRRLLTYYAAKATVFLAESNAEEFARKNANVFHWYQRPIGIIGITVLAGLIVLLAAYLIKQNLDIQL